MTVQSRNLTHEKLKSVMILFCQLSSQEPFVQIQSLVATFFEDCRGIEDNCQNIVNSKSLYLDFRMKSGLNDRISHSFVF